MRKSVTQLLFEKKKKKKNKNIELPVEKCALQNTGKQQNQIGKLS